MQALLPSPQFGPKEAVGSPDAGGNAAQSNNSKAAKVESAIEYIKQLQQQCSDKDRLIDQKDLEMEALRRELAALKGSGSPSKEPSPATTPPTPTTENRMKSESSASPSVENAT